MTSNSKVIKKQNKHILFDDNYKILKCVTH